MKISKITLKPLFLTFKEAYHWAGRVDYGAIVVLTRVETDEGLVGHGESTACFPAEGTLGLMGNIIPNFIGESPFNIDRLVYHARYLGTINDTIRLPNMLLAGLEMALWDIVGQAAGRPLYQLWGGAVRDCIDYFGFIQGDTAEELAASARALQGENFSVIYMKVGRGEKTDLRNVRAVRAALGPGVKLRVDANGAWDIFTAKNMIRRLSEFDLEFVEQPVDGRSLAALKQVRAASPAPIAVDQGAHSLEEVYEVCRTQAADVVVLSPHETGGAANFKKAAAISEAACLPVCLHGQFTSGLTDLFQFHLAVTLPNLTDGNQIMHQLLVEDLLAGPSLTPAGGCLGLDRFTGPGLGLTLNEDAVARAHENYLKWTGDRKKNMCLVVHE